MNAEEKSGKKAAVYARTSREFKGLERVSVPQQIESGKALVKSLGYAWAGEYVDSDTSGTRPPQQLAKTPRQKIRPALTRLIEDVKAGKVQVIILRKLDRLGRLKTESGIELLRLLDEYKCDIKCTDEELPKISTPEGELHLTFLLAFNSYEAKKVSQNIKRAKQYLKNHGLKMNGAREYGFKDGIAKEVLIDEPRAELVREIFNRYVSGASGWAINKWLMENHNDKTMYGKGWNTSSVKSILRNTHLIGKQANSDGELIDCVYPKIISDDVFYKAQKLLEANKRIKNGNGIAIHLLSCIMRCDCGRGVVTYGKGQCGNNRPKCYYCRDLCGKSTQIDEVAAEYFINEIIANVTVEETIINSSALVDIEKSKSKLAEIKEKMVANVISTDEYVELSKGIKDRMNRQEFKAKQEKAQAKKDSVTDFALMPIPKKRQILTDICKSIIMDRGGIIVEFADDVSPNMKSKLFHEPKDFSKKIYFRFVNVKRASGQKGKVVIPADYEIMGYEQNKTKNHGLLWSPIFNFKEGEGYADVKPHKPRH